MDQVSNVCVRAGPENQVLSFQEVNNLITKKKHMGPARKERSVSDHLATLSKSSNLKEKNLADGGKKVLQKLKDDWDDICKELNLSMSTELEKATEYFPRARAAFVSAAEVIQNMKLEAIQNRESARTVLKMMASDTVEIGVLASLIGQSGTLEQWWSIWKGLRLYDAECISPVQATSKSDQPPAPSPPFLPHTSVDLRSNQPPVPPSHISHIQAKLQAELPPSPPPRPLSNAPWSVDYIYDTWD